MKGLHENQAQLTGTQRPKDLVHARGRHAFTRRVLLPSNLLLFFLTKQIKRATMVRWLKKLEGPILSDSQGKPVGAGRLGLPEQARGPSAQRTEAACSSLKRSGSRKSQ